MNLKKIVLIVLGCISVALGAVGAAVPILPTFPFLLMAAFCFARSSERLHSWFIGTKLYKNNLESFVRGKGMTVKTKVRIMAIVTATMVFGFIMMGRVPVGQVILAIVWICHIYYFVIRVRTLPVSAS